MKHTYRPISEAPKNGTPIIAVVGGVEAAVAYDGGPILQGWFYWNEEDGETDLCKPQPEKWRRMY